MNALVLLEPVKALGQHRFVTKTNEVINLHLSYSMNDEVTGKNVESAKFPLSAFKQTEFLH